MAANSGIQWTDATWNCLAGCEAVSPGCANCYAATMTRRLEAMGKADYTGLTTEKHFNGKVRCLPHKLGIPLKWRKPRRVFVNSMSDLFHEDVPDAFIDRVFAVMALCPQHTFQVLTKRAERMHRYMTAEGCRQRVIEATETVWDEPNTAEFVQEHIYQSGGVLPNVWLGVSCEDQQRADERIPWLLKTPAAVRFVSAEPLLGPIDFTIRYQVADGGHHNMDSLRGYGGWGDYDRSKYKLHWVIDGCESGPRRREYHPKWSWSIQEQCKAAGVAYFRKQMIVNGKVSHDPAEWHADWRVREFPTCHT